MHELTRLDDRVTKLENEMADVRGIAETANREVAVVPAVLRGHTMVLNSLRMTQREHGERLDRLEHKVDDGFARMDKNFEQINENFAQINENFATVEARFNVIGAGIVKITELLTEADEPDER
jgi:chromosome segregation ATPase